MKSVCVCVFASKFLFYYEERKNSENFFMLILPEKTKIPLEKITSASISDDKMLLVTGIIALIAIISGLTCKRGERVNTALY